MSRSRKISSYYACVAQLVVQLIRNEQVAGSSPVTSSRKALFRIGTELSLSSFLTLRPSQGSSPIGLLQKTKRTKLLLRSLIGALQGTKMLRILVASHWDASPLIAKNSPPDCFLNAPTLSGFESHWFHISKKNLLFFSKFFSWRAARDSNP